MRTNDLFSLLMKLEVVFWVPASASRRKALPSGCLRPYRASAAANSTSGTGSLSAFCRLGTTAGLLKLPRVDMIVIRVGTSLSVSNMEYSLFNTSERSPIRLADITANDRVSGLPLATPFSRMSFAFCTFGSSEPSALGRRGRKEMQSPGRRRGTSFEIFEIRSFISLSANKATNLLVCRKLAEVLVLAT